MFNPETSNPSHSEPTMSPTVSPTMSDANAPNPSAPEPTVADEPVESFKDVFSEYEHSHSRKKEPGTQGREGNGDRRYGRLRRSRYRI